MSTEDSHSNKTFTCLAHAQSGTGTSMDNDTFIIHDFLNFTSK